MSNQEQLVDEFFIDAVGEVLNIGMGSAASSLSEMVNDVVTLSVPGVKLVPRPEAVDTIGLQTDSKVSGVYQQFEGAFSGRALLLFPEQQSLELVRAVLQQDISLEDLSEMEQEAMAEIGNVILNACICSMADFFQKKMEGDIPEFIHGDLNEVFSAGKDHEGHTKALVLLLNMDFSVNQKNIKGYVTFLMDFESLELLRGHVFEALGMEN